MASPPVGQMAAPWANGGRRDDGRRSHSPPYMHRRRDDPPRRSGSYDWRYNEPYDGPYPPVRRCSIGSDVRPNSPPRLSVKGYYPASTYRPRYDRPEPDYTPPTRPNTDGGANGITSPTAKPVPNKVWVNPEYRKRQRQQRFQAQIDGAADLEQSSKATDISSTEPSILRIEPQTASTSKLTKDQTNTDQQNGSSPMDLESDGCKPTTEGASFPPEDQVTNAAKPASDPPAISFPVPSETPVKQADGTHDGKQSHAPASWLRPKRKDAQNSGDPTVPASPTLPREPASKVAEFLHNFFSASIRSNGARQELHKLEKLHAQTMKDLRLIHGSEEAAAKKAHTSTEVASMKQKKSQLQRDAAFCDELSRLNANRLSALISSGIPSDEVKSPRNMEHELAEIRKDNKDLRDANLKLELRLAKMEASMKVAHASSDQFVETNATVASVKSDVSALLQSKDDVVKRLQTCEAVIDHVKVRALSISESTSESTSETRKFRDLQQRHEKSLEDLRSYFIELSTQHDSLQSKFDTEAAQMKGFDPAAIIQANTLVTQTLAELEERLSKAEADQVAFRERSTVQDRDQQKFKAIGERLTVLDKRLEAGEAEFSSKLSLLQSDIKVLRIKVNEHHGQISRTLQSTPTGDHGRPNVQSPGTQAPPRPMSGNPQPLVPSQPQYSHQAYGMAVTNPQQRPPSGGAWSPPGHQAAHPGQHPTSQWRSGSFAPASPGFQVIPSEVLQRIRTLEQFIHSHEHRLNSTTIESCWAPLVQHVMKYIGENYRYPESVSRCLADLQNTARGHSETLKLMSQQLTQAHSPDSAQRLSTISRLKDQLEEQAGTIRSLESWTQSQSTAINSLQDWTEHGFRDAVTRALDAEMMQTEELRKDLEERMQKAVDDFAEGATSAVQAFTKMQERGGKSEMSESEVFKKVKGLGIELQDLEKFCFAEIPKLHGLIAGLKPVQSTLKRPAPYTHENGAPNGQQGTEESSSESVLDSKRKRKRRMTGQSG